MPTMSRLKRACFAVFTFVIGVLILELSAGLMLPAVEPKPKPPAAWTGIPEDVWTEFDPKLGWFHKKNAEARLQTKVIDHKITTNSLGLRGPREYSLKKKEGITRLYLLGDSFIFGFGVRDDETITATIENSDPSIEAMNLGVAGYGIDQMKLLLDRFDFDFAPDLVIIALYPEDFWRATRSYTDAGYSKPYFQLKRNGELVLKNVPVPLPKSASGSQFPQIIENSVLLQAFEKSALVRLCLKLSRRLLKVTGLEDPDSSEEWRLGREVLKTAIASIRRHGAEPVLMIVPPARWITGSVEPLRDSLVRFSKREHTPMIDLTDNFRSALSEAPVEHWFIPDDFHWTAAGHELAARALLDYVNDWKNERD